MAGLISFLQEGCSGEGGECSGTKELGEMRKSGVNPLNGRSEREVGGRRQEG